MGAPKARLLAAVFAHWEQLVGPEIAAHAEPRSLRAGVLLLAVDQSGWATQLRYLAPDLLGRLRLATGTTEITEIQIRVAPPTAASKPVPTARTRGR
jgi:predicted nucleic acid-binding Zn ribbon protein